MLSPASVCLQSHDARMRTALFGARRDHSYLPLPIDPYDPLLRRGFFMVLGIAWPIIKRMVLPHNILPLDSVP
ncbi:hypothetical protein B1A75_17075 [Geobacillus sp. LEMMY01]|nr:hypothetical protein B1A75_17075 [Geobacillus sp. LEMMY01]